MRLSFLLNSVFEYSVLTMKFLVTAVLLATLLFVVSTNADPRRDQAYRDMRKLRNLVSCPRQNSGLYQKVCKYLSQYYVKAPDKTLASYIRGGMQKAGNRILHPVVYGNNVNMDIVKSCLRNFQDTINSHNKDAVEKYRRCEKQCGKEVGNRFEIDIDSAGAQVANCIVQSAH